MSINTRGVQFDEQLITSADWRHLNWLQLGRKSGVTRGCNVTASGNNLYISPGYFVIFGGEVAVDLTETVPISPVSTGTQYALLCYQLDMTQVNTETEFNQGSWVVLTSEVQYPQPLQEDLENGGTIYQMPFAKFTVTPSGISGLTPDKISFDTVTEINLTMSGWTPEHNCYTKTVPVPFMTISSKPIQSIIYPAGCDNEERIRIQQSAAKIIKIESGEGEVTFTITSPLSTDLRLGLRGF